MSAIATTRQPPALTTPTVDPVRFRDVSAQLRRAAGLADDVLLLGGVIFAIPFVILAIGLPVALFVQLLFWIVRLF